MDFLRTGTTEFISEKGERDDLGAPAEHGEKAGTVHISCTVGDQRDTGSNHTT